MYKALVRSHFDYSDIFGDTYQMYKALVRLHLDYCDIIYHEPPQRNQPHLGKTLTSLMTKVGRVQYQEALAVTGAWHGSNRFKLYEEV